MNYQFYANTLLFQDIAEDELAGLLVSLDTAEKRYPKGSVIYHTGEQVHSMGMVLSGRIQIESDDLWGNKSVLDSIGPGEVFAETYACIPKEPLMVSAAAAENSVILFLNIQKFLASSVPSNTKLIRNLLAISAEKNLTLSRRIFHTSSKSIRGRLISYLSFQAVHHKSNEFDIPFNRQELADYLSADRSALSNELSKMQKEGLLKTVKNHFILLDREKQ